MRFPNIQNYTTPQFATLQELVRLETNRRAKITKSQYSVGDKITFNAGPRGILTGILVKKNRVNLRIRVLGSGAAGTNWTVNPKFLVTV